MSAIAAGRQSESKTANPSANGATNSNAKHTRVHSYYMLAPKGAVETAEAYAEAMKA